MSINMKIYLILIQSFQMDHVKALAGVPNVELTSKITSLVKANQDLKGVIEDLRKLVISLQSRVQALETKCAQPVQQAKVLHYYPVTVTWPSALVIK